MLVMMVYEYSVNVCYDSEFVCIVECVYVVNGEMMSVYGDDMECMCIE